MSYDALLAPIREWLIEQALDDSDIVQLFEETCMRIVAIGIPLARARLFWPTLHPLFQGENINWELGKPAILEQFEHRDVASEEWLRSPLNLLVENNLEIFRRRLTGPGANLDFEVLHDLKEQGFTDYLLFGTRYQGTAFKVPEGGNDRGLLVTFSTRNESGFSGDDILALQGIQRRFAVTAKTIIQSRITANITTTYLGGRAGRYVLEGQIRRGDGKQTKAIVWYSDMRESTRMADIMEPEAYFDLLNAFFGATAGPVGDNGGEVLDFIGDAVLAIFPFETDEELQSAAQAANRAVSEAVAGAEKINEQRKSEGLETFRYGIALNKGDVMFGNIGIPSRLTFSVISPSVNEAARIETMTKTLGHQVLASGRFAKLIPDHWESLGYHHLNGVSQKTELFRYKN